MRSILIPRQSFGNRLVKPVAVVFCGWAISSLVYNVAWRFFSSSVHRPLAVICVVIMGITIGLGPLLTYLTALLRGASLKERVIASLFTPAAWILKELVIVSSVYNMGETLYYLFNPLFLGILSVIAIEMGIAEITGRYRIQRKQKGYDTPIVSPAPVLTIFLGLLAVYVFMVWGDRLGYWYLHQAGYQVLFPS